MKRAQDPVVSTAIVVRASPRGLLARPAATNRRPIVEMWLEGRSQRTISAYADDLKDFARFLGLEATDGDAAAAVIIEKTHPQANELVLSYRSAMVEKRLSPATINRRLAALRSLVKLANLLGHVTWLLGVENVKGGKYRDTAGPGEEKINTMMRYLVEHGGRTSVRDMTIVRMMFDMGLRRGEVAELLVDHVSLEERRVSVLAKGRTERGWFTIPSQVFTLLATWLHHDQRGNEPGSLFGLTGHGVWTMISRLGVKAGVGKVNPHGFRHSGITRALDVMGGDVRAVQKFSRHRNVNTLMIYDDNRRDMFGEIAEKASAKKDDE